jgi:hypothetical protein
LFFGELHSDEWIFHPHIKARRPRAGNSIGVLPRGKNGASSETSASRSRSSPLDAFERAEPLGVRMRLRRVLSEVGDLADRIWGGQMSFGRVASLVIAIVAVLALFVEIPIVSDYAFWFLVGALIIWMGVHSQNTKNRFRWQTMLSIALLLVAIVGVFVEIPIVSAYAFWVLFVAYLVSVGSTSFSSN